MNTFTIFFLAPSHAGASLLLTYFQTLSGTTLTDVMSAATDDNRYMISGEVDEFTFHRCIFDTMKGVSRITGKHMTLQTVDEKLHMYRVTMK